MEWRSVGVLDLAEHPNTPSLQKLERSMLSKEENELMTRVGPGTPAGEMLRRYWWPVAFTDSVKPKGPPTKVRLLGEEFVLFRDGGGNLGLLELHCSHRGTSLEFGRVEDNGIRCCYHGWLYDRAGKCLEQPAEPEGSTFKDRIQHPAFHARTPAVSSSPTSARNRRRYCPTTTCWCAKTAAAWSAAARSFATGCSARRILPTARIPSLCMQPAIPTWR